jgi:hypothetical protein
MSEDPESSPAMLGWTIVIALELSLSSPPADTAAQAHEALDNLSLYRELDLSIFP